MNPVQNGFQLTTQNSQRSTQLMGNISHPSSAALFRLPQRSSHIIEIQRQLPHLILRSNWQSGFVIPCCQPFCCRRNLFKRLSEMVSQKPGDQCRQPYHGQCNPEKKVSLLFHEVNVTGLTDRISRQQSKEPHCPILILNGMQIQLRGQFLASKQN